ncbi:hypothetical protein AGRHK599_LOCUS1280 [Rhizobium rhizogenes]|uniref:Uncharacterized protein n=1 Tax=Rhizobium rhizogenes TaxID=359 RepID=A0AAN2DCM1_RHIRH|nr:MULTISPECIES: hypothetical protein [Rhizobium/Agrobacterium group]MCZ7443051.1 hypothetical protein [Rhizobium rhizogenes]NSZ79037.1 hypothetical protein [Agrobacterium tumefaciens]CAD0211253.1 hypothetical protein AGRHK599_LOCUS1280 [Rhizobium rhizogenes]
MGETYIKVDGAVKRAVDIYRKINGVWQSSTELYSKLPADGALKNVFTSEIVINITSNRQDLILENLFTVAQWTSSARKRVVIASNVIVNGSSWDWALAAQNGGRAASWGGTLTLENYGSIQGRGGQPNGGRGGNAIFPDDGQTWTKKLQLINAGTILGGGGGGGQGGTGGAGIWQQEFMEGPQYNRTSGSASYWVAEWTQNRTSAIWNNGIFVPPAANSGVTERDGTDGWRYYRHTMRDNGDGSASYYEVIRRRWENRNSSGGTGGNGGAGQGWQQGRTNGVGGAGGGTNAGSGGTGGNGGGWGAAGAGGATGNSGNNGGGTAGGAGGAAGVAYRSAIVQVVSNTGTISGRIT